MIVNPNGSKPTAPVAPAAPVPSKKKVSKE
jgi:hypothetical protein